MHVGSDGVHPLSELKGRTTSTVVRDCCCQTCSWFAARGPRSKAKCLECSQAFQAAGFACCGMQRVGTYPGCNLNVVERELLCRTQTKVYSTYGLWRNHRKALQLLTQVVSIQPHDLPSRSSTLGSGSCGFPEQELPLLLPLD